MRSLATLLGLVLLVAQAQAKPALSAREKQQVRREIRSLMSYHFNLFSTRNPSLKTTFTPVGKGRVRVDATLYSDWGGRREAQQSRFAIVKRLPNGKWAFARSSSYHQLETPRSAADSVRQRDAVVNRAVVVRRAGAAKWVLYDKPDSGNVLRLAKVDAAGKIVTQSKNLAPRVMRTALAVHQKGRRGQRSWAHLRSLSKDGRSIEVEVYTANGQYLEARQRDHYRVGLNGRGEPTGEVRHIGQDNW